VHGVITLFPGTTPLIKAAKGLFPGKGAINPD
jgi:hypothetical protein